YVGIIAARIIWLRGIDRLNPALRVAGDVCVTTWVQTDRFACVGGKNRGGINDRIATCAKFRDESAIGRRRSRKALGRSWPWRGQRVNDREALTSAGTGREGLAKRIDSDTIAFVGTTAAKIGRINQCGTRRIELGHKCILHVWRVLSTGAAKTRATAADTARRCTGSDGRLIGARRCREDRRILDLTAAIDAARISDAGDVSIAGRVYGNAASGIQ